MEYDLKIEKVRYITDKGGLKNVIISIDWIYTYNENILTGTLEIDEPSSENFIKFEDVNKIILVQWVLDSVDIDNKHLLLKDIEQSSIVKDDNAIIPEIITVDVSDPNYVFTSPALK